MICSLKNDVVGYMKKILKNYHVIITAAGLSRRMGQFKPLMPLGNGCILQSTIESFQKAGLNNITVIVGYRKDELTPILQKLGVQIVENENYKNSDMLESIKLGISNIPLSTSGILLCPGDIPLIRPQTIQKIVEEYHTGSTQILIPVYHGKSGHPPVFSGDIIPSILAYGGDYGLRGIFEKHKQKTGYLEVPDSEIIQDTDLPKDYERLLLAYQKKEKP